MGLARVLVANRGEIAVRVLRAAGELGLPSLAVYSEDDAASPHIRKADQAVGLRGTGPAAYLDMEQIIVAAQESGCDAIHPGYGFLSENAAFARRCAEEGIVFVGPRPELLDVFGDKTQARAIAQRLDVPVLPATEGATSLESATEFLSSLGDDAAVMVKAVAGGGGRGMRVARDPAELETAYERCRSEAASAFGSGDLYVEQLLLEAKHIEVQVVGDGSGTVIHLWERDCSVQRRHQKLVEIAPSPQLSAAVRERICAAAVRMAGELQYNNIGTFEFLVDPTAVDPDQAFVFLETNPRLQVEHTVTEEITGVDLVKTQFHLAGGQTLTGLGLCQSDIPAPRGFAIQVRINAETLAPDGTARPAGGNLTAWDLPSGPGIRVDAHGYSGYSPNPRFDSLLAKLIARDHNAEFAATVDKADRALSECHISGVATTIPLSRAILSHADFVGTGCTTRFLDTHLTELLDSARDKQPWLFFHDAPGATPESRAETSAPEGTVPVRAPLLGTVVSVDVSENDLVHSGQQLLVLEAMKMEHVVSAPVSGLVRRIDVTKDQTVSETHALVHIEETAVEGDTSSEGAVIDPDHIRPDLAEVLDRHALGRDTARPHAVERRRRTGQRTARENIDDLCDLGSFVEYGPLVVAAQRQRRSMDDLVRNTPADGQIGGLGSVNGDEFGPDRTRCVVMSYDYTVLAGTQGLQNHDKTDRLLELAQRRKSPVVLFAEGGGGRPGDTDTTKVAGLDVMTFHRFGTLSGLVPLVGIASGRCFAGNAALLGCCDVIIATQDSSIGMGGPAMIEGGGLGAFQPDEVGPIDVQVPNGVVDIPVADEAQAVDAAKQYLSYFQGPASDWDCADQRLLRHVLPENRLRVYDIRTVIDTLADTGSVLELRRHFGTGIVTALIRVEGRPLGLIANDPAHLGGAIDSDSADKATRFLQLCDAHGLPIVSLCDTPGFMVGPEAEKTATVRHFSRMFVTGANLTVPIVAFVLRKGYGLGAQAMAGGSLRAPIFTVSWPTGEFGGMGLEGAVKLGYRKELEAVEDPDEREALFQEKVAAMYEKGKALSTATVFEIDDVIDPAESRKWISTALFGVQDVPVAESRTYKRRPYVDTW